jgi:hypothetical protein
MVVTSNFLLFVVGLITHNTEVTVAILLFIIAGIFISKYIWKKNIKGLVAYQHLISFFLAFLMITNATT